MRGKRDKGRVSCERRACRAAARKTRSAWAPRRRRAGRSSPQLAQRPLRIPPKGLQSALEPWSAVGSARTARRESRVADPLRAARLFLHLFNETPPRARRSR